MNYDSTGLTMTFPVAKLIEALKTNREKHKQMVTEAKKNFIAAQRTELLDKLKRLDEGKKIDTYSNLRAPGDNTSQYDTAISMLEMTTDTNIKLGQAQYNCYVLDNWSWKRDFLMSASSYSDTAKKTLDDTEDEEE